MGSSEPSGWAMVNHKFAHAIGGQEYGQLPHKGGQFCFLLPRENRDKQRCHHRARRSAN
jgi:hypothetical protein